VVGVGLLAAGTWFAHSQFPHVQQRISIWLDPWQDPKGAGFQVVEAAFALAAGGIAGTGLNLGSPTRIPVVESDFIFAAIGEELGLLGATAVLVAFMCMIGAGLRIAVRTEVPFERLLATGLTTLVGMQAFLIIGGVTRVLPLTGLPLPFMSYGGSSLIGSYILIALLLRISHDTAERADARSEPGRATPVRTATP
jgi:peptidoglycan glycosyltransferase